MRSACFEHYIDRIDEAWVLLVLLGQSFERLETELIGSTIEYPQWVNHAPLTVMIPS